MRNLCSPDAGYRMSDVRGRMADTSTRMSYTRRIRESEIRIRVSQLVNRNRDPKTRNSTSEILIPASPTENAELGTENVSPANLPLAKKGGYG